MNVSPSDIFLTMHLNQRFSPKYQATTEDCEMIINVRPESPKRLQAQSRKRPITLHVHIDDLRKSTIP